MLRPVLRTSASTESQSQASASKALQARACRRSIAHGASCRRSSSLHEKPWQDNMRSRPTAGHSSILEELEKPASTTKTSKISSPDQHIKVCLAAASVRSEQHSLQKHLAGHVMYDSYSRAQKAMPRLVMIGREQPQGRQMPAKSD